ncbi:TPR repeat protein oca3 [Schizosaccharomyces pombe]|uniref:TPR repeat protein oca3 n=1 Tax=Schizosaccharomyces pombe (strain 972 / ATCC 24843) TaxID=284812 RepID=OCA3_SCHPO|nr:putative TPR repeat-containing protein Oca3 [Schizosaccharomyces pombe]O60110.3 RecName: Full=TPR repeat protein oca3; AltName: Full=Overexpression-mediated cell cycle arrest protein 3 [Schizosaccharomyces pombe 972h-]CAA18435.2 TPR repeat protein Oca3/ ER membrane protein complex Ecm2 (predicted) [Schizosaccharomyces pombe]|eukprot:NP_595921.2 putative TPR repeat-containing protein Oca3 [Schizosaccharomyces pombe]
MSNSILKVPDQNPQEIVALFSQQEAYAKLGKYKDEIWDVYQKVFIAALTTGETVLAKKCWNRLNDRFHKSPRVEGLYGMFLEATASEKDAMSYYNSKLSEDPTHTVIYKRKLALLRSMGQTKECIQGLINYLDTFYNDLEAWAELADIYVSVEAFESAIFCYEEMVLLQPFEPRLFARLGDLYFVLAQSNATNYWFSLKHYCRSVEICEEYFHGWFGISKCCQQLLELSRTELKRLLSKVNEKISDTFPDTESVRQLYQLSLKKSDLFAQKQPKLKALLEQC